MTRDEDMVVAVARTIYDIGRTARMRGVLTMWTIYDRPADYPDGFIARCFETGAGPEPVPTDYTIMGSLEAIRASMERCGLYRMNRNEGDHQSVVETWL
jgi:hypothetical protein